MREAEYQAWLIRRLYAMFPGCHILKNDSAYQQGIPDLTIFYGDRYAMLEVKASENTPRQPNQEHFVREFDRMSFAAFIYPQNESEVLSALRKAFSSRRVTRVSNAE